MSTDTYFCFCCLATNDLINLFGETPDTNYADMLKELYSIQPLKEDYEDDSYVCKDCARALREARRFQQQVLETLRSLQVNGLIKLNKTADHTLVTKASSEYASERDEKYKPDDKKLAEEVKQELKHPETELERDKQTSAVKRERVTMPRKCKEQPTVKTEVLVEVTKDFEYYAECEAMPADAKDLPKHTCETCEEGFLTRKMLLQHMPSHVKDPLKSEKCETVYNSLNSHSPCIPPSPSRPPPPSPPAIKPKVQKRGPRCPKFKFRKLFCSLCEIQFASKQESDAHRAAEHPGPVPWMCDICGKVFSYQSSLYSHVRAHALPALSCEHCDYRTPHQSTLRKHRRTHASAGEKKHQCPQCPRKFLTPSILAIHVKRLHEGLRPFQCELCQRRFFERNRLNLHMDSHNKIKRFECDVCHTRFARRHQWKTHLQKQHGVTVPRQRPGRAKTILLAGEDVVQAKTAAANTDHIQADVVAN